MHGKGFFVLGVAGIAIALALKNAQTFFTSKI
jgi:hypothetical protein